VNHFQLSSGPATQAVITTRGANLFSFSINSKQYIAFGQQYGGGDVMIPFPNRIQDGQYRFYGVDYQLPINEPQRHNAIAGLVRDLDWLLVRHTHDEVVFKLPLDEPQGYPFKLLLEVGYKLSPHSLTVSTRVKNVGQTAAPFGIGFHPYFRIPGAATIDTCSLEIPSGSYLWTDSRMIPGLPPLGVSGGSYDFRAMRAIGPTVFDTCFTDLSLDPDGASRVKLRGNYEEVIVWMDASYKFLQIFSGDTLPTGDQRTAIAIEPQSCPANSFNNGLGLLVLDPQVEHRSQWGFYVN
jgi:aldose 1-epimerase